MEHSRRLVVGISGASGAPIAVEVLRALKAADIETHLVLTRGAALTIPQETDLSAEQVRVLASVCYENDAIGAAIASGSFRTMGMLIVPCSMKTAAGICSGYSDNLLLRAADVTLKERRPLVLCARESPLSPVHLRNLYELSRLGAAIVPPMASYYSRPQTAQDITRQIAGRLLDAFGIEYAPLYRWEGLPDESKRH